MKILVAPLPSELPQRLFGIKKNSLSIRLSNRFFILLLRTGLNLKSSAQEIQATLEQLLLSPLSHIVACGQLTFGDVLIIRTNKNNNKIEIERVNQRSGKAGMARIEIKKRKFRFCPGGTAR